MPGGFSKNVILPVKFYGMKIFLNNRTIRFVNERPENPAFSDFVVEFQSVGELQAAWEDFGRYEKYLHMVIVEPSFTDFESSAAFKAFSGFFKYVPAAGGLVKNEKGEYLFIHRLGNWDLPKGKIDKKDISGSGTGLHDVETARVAAVREVKEETGLTGVTIQDELSSTWHIYFHKEKWVLKRTRWFAMQADSGQNLKPATREGIFLVKWTTPGAIHCILSHTYASLREFLLEIVF
jgi:8-oxo-dGTP pyrophosphatase MutT (NUDIX family)